MDFIKYYFSFTVDKIIYKMISGLRWRQLFWISRNQVLFRVFSTTKLNKDSQGKPAEEKPNESEGHKNVKINRKLSSNFLLNLPYDVDGTHLVSKLPGRNKTEIFMNEKLIDEEILIEKFHELIQKFYVSIAMKDYTTLFSLAEKRFASKIKNSSDVLSEKGIDLQFTVPDLPHIARKDEDKSYIFDKMFEKGVYTDRDLNDNNYDYLLDSEFEGEGLRYYFHKYFTGYETHYYLDRVAGKTSQEDINSRYRFKYEMEKRNRSVVFRVFSVIRNIGRFSSSVYKGPNGQGIYPPNYTGNHLVIFENQLIEPNIESMYNLNIDDWIKVHKINHNDWRVSDVDNYMHGNKFFNKIMDQNEFKLFVDKQQSHKSFIDDRVTTFFHI